MSLIVSLQQIVIYIFIYLFIFVDKLAGVVAVEITGGPDVPFHPGREVNRLTYFVSDSNRLVIFIVTVVFSKITCMIT